MNARELQKEIDQWAKRNFDYFDKVGWGCIEELGEYCHTVLKFNQKIRRQALKGEGNWADQQARISQFNLDLKDSIADGMIYVLHWCELNETYVSFEETRQYCERFVDSSELEAISILLQCCSTMIRLQLDDAVHPESYRGPGQRVFNNFALLAKSRGWDWEPNLFATWKEVSKRDWKKNPQDGKV